MFNRRAKIVEGEAEGQALNGDGRFVRLDLQPVLHWKTVAWRMRQNQTKLCSLSPY
jgi:hypothetical protein